MLALRSAGLGQLGLVRVISDLIPVGLILLCWSVLYGPLQGFTPVVRHSLGSL